MTKWIKGTIIALLCVVFVLSVVMVTIPQAAFADGDTQGQTSSTNFVGFTGLKGADLHDYTKSTVASDKAPVITVLVHGQGSNASYWSNYTGDNQEIVYDSRSLIEQIKTASNGTIYQAAVKGENIFSLDKLTKNQPLSDDSEYYTYSFDPIYKIDEFNKHSIVVFQASDDNKSAEHDVSYQELEFVIDSILADYKFVTGSIPKINLISHSRGGILSMMYAIDHPYNVSSLISMGTPYNGSLFAKSDWIVKGLGLENSVECGSGQDILSDERQEKLRTEWNSMLQNNPSANINAIAIGSKTRLDCIGEVISGGHIDGYLGQFAFLNKLLGGLTTYAGEAVAKLKEENPGFASLVFSCINIGIDVAELLVDDSKSEEIAALQDIINNCEIAYGDLVLRDDMFIDYDSQTAVGYNGFDVITRVFSAADSHYDLIATNNVPIPHNLETRDPIIINNILSRISLGDCEEYVYQADTYNNEVDINVVKDSYSKINFNAMFDGTYSINSPVSINKVVIDDEAGNVIVNTNSTEISFEGKKNKSYSIYFSIANRSDRASAEITITLPDLENANNSSLQAHESKTFVKSFLTRTVKSIQTNSAMSVNVYDNSGEVVSTALNGALDLIFEADRAYYFEIVNNSNSSVNVDMILDNVSTVYLDDNQNVEFYKYYKYVSYTSTSNDTYTFTFRWNDGEALPSIRVYDNSLNIKTALQVVNYGNIKMYQVSLQEGETVYFGFKNDSNVVQSAEIEVNQFTSEYTWKIDDNPIVGFIIELKRDESYSGILSFYFNGQLLDGQILSTRDSLYITVNNSRVMIYNDAPLTYGSNYQYVVWSSYNGDYRYNEVLQIKVIPGALDAIKITTNDVTSYTFNLENMRLLTAGERVTIKLKVTDYMGNDKYQTVDATSSSVQNIALTYMSNYFYAGKIKLSLEEITYMYGTYRITCTNETHPELFSSVLYLTGYFESGYGLLTNDPYLIANETQLNNIRKLIGENSTYTSPLSCHFKLIEDIDLTSIWKPIICTYNGWFDGDNHTINGLQIIVDVADVDYGLFTSIGTGTVKNLHFTNVNIYGTASAGAHETGVGVIAGHSQGNIDNCTVESGTIAIYMTDSFVGGLVGFQLGKNITNCETSADLHIIGYWLLGGIAGCSMNTTIDSCNNYASITYYYNKDNGCVGGIVGKNMSGNVLSCKNYGTITFGSTFKYDADRQPCMGQICGWNVSGTINVEIDACQGKVNYSNLEDRLLIKQRKYCTNGAVGRSS